MSFATRRLVRVAVASCVSAALAVGCIAADIFDLLPGPLTIRGSASVETPVVPNAITGNAVVGAVDQNVAIDKNQAKALIDELLADPSIGSKVGVAIDDSSGTPVAAHQPDTSLEPASTLKTLTALAAASSLNMSATLPTEVYLDASEETSSGSSGASSGDQGHSEGEAILTLKGNGDMMLGASADDPDHINGRAGLGTLARQTAQALKAQGITSVQLRYDDSLFGSVRSPARINEDQAVGRYYTPISSMAVDGGRMWPQGMKESNPDEVTLYPDLSLNTASDTASTFATRLTEQGIHIEGAIDSAAAPKGVSPLAAVRSAPLADILRYTLRNSDNTLAEEFGRLVALHVSEENTPIGATKAVINQLHTLKVNTAGLHMEDCSGLSAGSQVSVRTLAQIQSINLGSDGPAAAAEGLSIAGLVGTAKHRLADDAAAGLLRVKTGSLSGATSLSGNVSRSNGGVLSFAVIVNEPTDYMAARAAIDTFAAKLAQL